MASTGRRAVVAIVPIVVIVVIVVIATALCLTGLLPPAAARTTTRAAPAGRSAAARACGPLPRLRKARAEEIMAGRLTIAPFPAVTIDPHRDGDIDWRLDPFRHPTWTGDFKSGGWIETLVSGYLAGGPRARAYRARARAITRSWLRGVPLSARDPQTVICVSEAFPGQKWIMNAIPPAVGWEAAHWDGAWNHGLKQDLELLRIGCAYPARAFGGAALRWRQTAVRQMTAAFEPNPLGPSVDAQGAVNEQATLYEDFVYYLWQRGLPLLASCRYRLPRWITARIALMPAFLGYATEPDGDLVQIGDTYVERPVTAPRQPSTVAVYDAGYVFGRSGWGGGASFYSLRFGRGQQIHGHDDHMGLTYYARDRDLIVNAGHTGYENTSYRAFLKSPEASSVLVMPGVPFDVTAPTALLRDQIGRHGQFYEFFDTAFRGDPRYRGVYVSQRPDLVLVLDRASGASRYQQLWHLAPALRVTRLSRSYAIASASAPDTRLLLLQIALPGQRIPRGSTRVIRGQRHPGTSVTTSIGRAAGGFRLRVRVGRTVSVFGISADGVITG